MKKEEEIFVKETFQSAAGQRYRALQKVRGKLHAVYIARTHYYSVNSLNVSFRKN